MSDIGTISNLAGANPASARSAPGSRSDPPAPATVQNAVGQPLTTAQSSVTQSPSSAGAERKRNADPDGHQPNLQSGPAPTRQQLTETVQDLNQRLSGYDTNLQFEIDDQSQQMVVQIVDRETKEVVRQIPSEKALALAKFFKEMEDNQKTERSAAGKDSKRLKMEGQLLQAIA